MCLTATATPNVRKDVIKTLGLDERRLKVFTMTTARKNLHYEVRFKSDEMDQFDNFLPWLQAIYRRRSQDPARKAEIEKGGERIDGVSGIIYVLYRSTCEQLAARLRSHKIGARPYHAGLPVGEKGETLTRWVNNEPGYDIIVATTAFGMGIDKENVRFVVHWQLPKSFEGYYQEAGRAGRDGKASVCLMYYSREDRDRALGMLRREKDKMKNFEARKKSLMALVDYCETTEKCRHRGVVEYFGERERPPCVWACDFCKVGREGLRRAKREGLTSEEIVSTQREMGAFDNGGYDEYD